MDWSHVISSNRDEDDAYVDVHDFDDDDDDYVVDDGDEIIDIIGYHWISLDQHLWAKLCILIHLGHFLPYGLDSWTFRQRGAISGLFL